MYQWLVQSGRIGIEKVDKLIRLDIDTQGEKSCLLTLSDTQEIANILTVLCQDIWDSLDQKPPYSQQYTVNDNQEFVWHIPDNELVLNSNTDLAALEVKVAKKHSFELNINQAIELIQVMQQLVNASS